MDKEKVNKLIYLILYLASQNDDWRDRQLGPIHLIKYIYLADLEYAKIHNGQTLTKIKWQFYNFGPWSAELYNQIEPALQFIEVDEILLSGNYENDTVRWRLKKLENNSFANLENEFDFEVVLALKEYIKKFGSDTEELLDFVYKTPPMLVSAPKEFLDFSIMNEQNINSDPEYPIQQSLGKKISNKKRKELIKKLKSLKQKVNNNLEKRIQKQQKRKEKFYKNHKVIYDEIYWQGLQMLDNDAGEPLKEEQFTCLISDDVWKSKARYDPDLS